MRKITNFPSESTREKTEKAKQKESKNKPTNRWLSKIPVCREGNFKGR